MDERVLIKNSDLNHKVSHYRKIYEQQNHVVFEMKEGEYKALSEITKSYKLAKDLTDFDYEVWTEQAKNNDLFTDDKATFVFGFLVLEWGGNTHVSAERHGEYVLVDIAHK